MSPTPRLLTPGLRIHGATYVGICTAPSGALYALLLQDRKPESRLTWAKAQAWAASDGVSDLPTRPEAALLFQLVKAKLEPLWHWTNETCSWDASYAWDCTFASGTQGGTHKSAQGSCVALRRLPLESFDSLVSLAESAEVAA
jgi:hypothetical protein